MTVLSREELKRLKLLPVDGFPVLSVYWTINRAAGSADQIELKNRFAEVEVASRTSTAAQRLLSADAPAVQRFVFEEYAQDTAAVAIFSSSPAKLWQVYHLNAPVTDRVIVAGAPYIRPLVRLLSEHALYAVVLVDSSRARLFHWTQGSLKPHGELANDVPREDDAGKVRQERFQRRQEAWFRRHLQNVADRLVPMFQAEQCQGLWVGASDTAARALEGHLHPYVKGKLCASLRIDTSAPETEVRDRIAPLVAAREREHRRGLINRLETAAKSGGNGAIGLDDSLTEWQSGNVMTLLIRRNYSTPGGRCSNCRSLTLNARTPCPYCSASVKPLDNVVDELAEDAFLNGVEVVFVPEGEGLEGLGSIGALLRFGG